MKRGCESSHHHDRGRNPGPPMQWTRTSPLRRPTRKDSLEKKLGRSENGSQLSWKTERFLGEGSGSEDSTRWIFQGRVAMLKFEAKGETRLAGQKSEPVYNGSRVHSRQSQPRRQLLPMISRIWPLVKRCAAAQRAKCGILVNSTQAALFGSGGPML